MFVYRHPLYTVESVQAQKRLDEIQNTSGVSYCGAWTKYGFHEDGFSSGLKVAKEHLGAELPFEFVDSTYSRGHKPELGVRDYLLRLVLLALTVLLRVFEGILYAPGIRLLMNLIGDGWNALLDVGEKNGWLV